MSKTRKPGNKFRGDTFKSHYRGGVTNDTKRYDLSILFRHAGYGVSTKAEREVLAEVLRNRIKSNRTKTKGVSHHYIDQLTRRLVTERTADEYATALGIHPASLWEDWYEDE